VLVQWKGAKAASASWVPLHEFRRLFPSYQLADELLLQGGEMLWSAKYTNADRRSRPPCRTGEMEGRVVALEYLRYSEFWSESSVRVGY